MLSPLSKRGKLPKYIYPKYVFLNVKFAQFYVNSEKKCARFDDDGDYEGHSGSILFFFFPPPEFFSGRVPCFGFYCTAKNFAEIVNVFPP